MWDATTGSLLLNLIGHEDMRSAAWSPAGDRIATGGQDGTTKVWDASASSPTYGEELLTLAGHKSVVYFDVVAFGRADRHHQ